MSYQHFFQTLKPDSQETAQNFEKRVLQKCLRITFYTYKPVNPFHFLKKHQNRCTLLQGRLQGRYKVQVHGFQKQLLKMKLTIIQCTNMFHLYVFYKKLHYFPTVGRCHILWIYAHCTHISDVCMYNVQMYVLYSSRIHRSLTGG